VGEYLVFLARFHIGGADDEGGAGFIDEEVVNLVDDGVVKRALDATGEVDDHVIAQVVEAELAAGAVGYIRLVGFFTVNVAEVLPAAFTGVVFGVVEAGGGVLVGVLHGINASHADPQRVIDGAHPVGVAPRQIVINRDQVNPFARQRI